MTASIATEVCARVTRTIPAGSQICVGFSGGLDSTVLLEVLSEHLSGYKISAVHVNHGLSPNASDWVRFCERFCANHGVPLAVQSVRVDTSSPEGIEGAARTARYATFAARPEPFLALAHHLDDQAETVLMQLLRGTGLKGIAAMPELRELRGTGVRIFRPLLDFSRAQLLEYARERELKWIEDESNASSRFDRNFLRHDVGPLLDARYPGWRDSLARFARHAGSANALLDQLADLDGVPEKPGVPMPLAPQLSEERRANALRAFLARNVVTMPTEARLAEIGRQLFESRDDARVRIDHAGISIVRHKDAVMIERGLNVPAAVAMPRGAWRVDWRHEPELDLGGDRGVVCFENAKGVGIAAGPAKAGGDWYFAARSGGETIRLGIDRPTRTLKNLLQEREIPMWQREKLPLLFHDGRLVWVPGVGIAAEYACGEGQEGFQPSWRVAGKAPVC
ncbi:MAG TPA: tRNA lysidine(34) synthetase TilS [Usitatibacter sp.]|nr:tRNA lysidine(34) synthetase TilS [Usitatibacter sp.]